MPSTGRHSAGRQEAVPRTSWQPASTKWQTAAAAPRPADSTAKRVRPKGWRQPTAWDAIEVATHDAWDHATTSRHAREHGTTAWPRAHWYATRWKACRRRRLTCRPPRVLYLTRGAQLFLVAAAKGGSGCSTHGRSSGS